MEPVRPPTGPAAPQGVARVLPLGRGWMLVALETGAALRNPALGVDMRLTPADAEALRQGVLSPEAVARPAAAPPPPPRPVTVVFSPEALRLSGQMAAPGQAQKGGPVAPLPPQVRAGVRAFWIWAICLALLVLVLIGTG